MVKNKNIEQAFCQIKRESLIFLSIGLISVISVVQAALTLHYKFKSPWLKQDQQVVNRNIVSKYYAHKEFTTNFCIVASP
jgi:flagellar basal body-associated protein FliL